MLFRCRWCLSAGRDWEHKGLQALGTSHLVVFSNQPDNRCRYVSLVALFVVEVVGGGPCWHQRVVDGEHASCTRGRAKTNGFHHAPFIGIRVTIEQWELPG